MHNQEILPLLEEHFGNLKNYYDFLLKTKSFQRFLAPIVRESKRKVLKRAIREIQMRMFKTGLTVLFSSNSSFNSWERQRKELENEEKEWMLDMESKLSKFQVLRN